MGTDPVWHSSQERSLDARGVGGITRNTMVQGMVGSQTEWLDRVCQWVYRHHHYRSREQL